MDLAPDIVTTAPTIAARRAVFTPAPREFVAGPELINGRINGPFIPADRFKIFRFSVVPYGRAEEKIPGQLYTVEKPE